MCLAFGAWPNHGQRCASHYLTSPAAYCAVCEDVRVVRLTRASAVIESQPQEQPSKGKLGFRVAGAIVMTCLLWGLAVVLPVWETRSNQYGAWSVVPGYFPALLGFLGILAGCPAWFANLFLIPLCIMLPRSRRAGFLLSVVAFAVAASAYTLPALYGDNDEAVIVRRLIGYYFWLGSFLAIALAHALLATTTQWRWIVARIAVVALMVLALAGLEIKYPVGVSRLERTLKDPKDLTGLTAALARHPPQTEKDGALWWAIRQDLGTTERMPSQRVVMLIAAGANPNKSDSSGITLLMQALPPHGSEAFVELLVRAGADVNARDCRGKTVLDIAQEIGSGPECQKILVNAGARSSSQLPALHRE